MIKQISMVIIKVDRFYFLMGISFNFLINNFVLCEVKETKASYSLLRNKSRAVEWVEETQSLLNKHFPQIENPLKYWHSKIQNYFGLRVWVCLSLSSPRNRSIDCVYFYFYLPFYCSNFGGGQYHSLLWHIYLCIHGSLSTCDVETITE